METTDTTIIDGEYALLCELCGLQRLNGPGVGGMTEQERQRKYHRRSPCPNCGDPRREVFKSAAELDTWVVNGSRGFLVPPATDRNRGIRRLADRALLDYDGIERRDPVALCEWVLLELREAYRNTAPACLLSDIDCEAATAMFYEQTQGLGQVHRVLAGGEPPRRIKFSGAGEPNDTSIF